MKLLILGAGKTGSLVADFARERHHQVQVATTKDNSHCAALAPDKLSDTDLVIDYTTPHSVVANIEACMRCRKPMVVGTTGWLSDMPRVRSCVEQNAGSLLWGGNFSIGVNLFYEAARQAAEALKHHYSGQIFERHHVHKKDAPSGTASAMRDIIRDASGTELEITSFREGDVVGMHELVLTSSNDTIYLCHDSKSRRAFAEGSVRGAEWLHQRSSRGEKGIFDFRTVWREL
jgi:4-hydroxy-tetrahydrodipicolinate reductase